MRTKSERAVPTEQHNPQTKSREKSLTPMKAKRVKKVRPLLLRYPPKRLLLNKRRVSSSNTTSTAIQLDNCLQNSTPQTTDPTASSKPNVIAQTSADQTDYRFPLLISDEGSFQDLDVSVKFKAVSGSIDRAGGLVFRLKDPNNYYIVRANALENNYRLYHVVNGRRTQFAGANLKVTSGEWHELRVEAAGNKITCYYDGNKKIEATDNTFKDAGKVGLWTKADSVTYFDDLKVTAK
ncbi:MAG: hypothetical protein DMG97_42835 [Acidobacteria bacterium]|nr:MAG: hypothetical protein DMG97_42835 [Acidobacteriota bacterium]